MKISRRDLSALLPLLAAAKASAQQPARPVKKNLPGTVYHVKDIAYAGDEKKKGRRIFRGVNRGGFDFEMHETVLGPGVQTHEPHKHAHEEIMIVLEGAMESFLDGKWEMAETGAVLYNGTNQMHTVRNVGTVPVRYYVIELRGDEA